MNIERLILRERMPITFVALIGIAMGVDVVPRTGTTLLILTSIAVGVAIAFARPVDMLGLLALSIPLQAYGAVDVLGANLTLTKLCVICLLIGWLPGVAVGRRVVMDSVVWGYAAVAVALVISVVAMSDAAGWAAELYRWTVAAFIFVVARTEITERHHVNRLIVGVCAGVVGISAYAMYQVLTEDGPASFVINGLLRAYGTFGQPNPLAAYLEMSLPLLAAMTLLPAVHRTPRTVPPFLLAMMVVSIAAGTMTIVLTQSRGGWIGIGAAVVILVGSLPPKYQVGVAGGALAALAGLFMLGWGNVLSDRLTSILSAGGERVLVSPRNWANEERRAHWGTALNMVRAHPWAGVGAGGFNDAYREYTSEWRFRVSRGHAHSGYLQMGAQAGIAGAVTFAAWIGSILLRLIERWRAGRPSTADGRVVGGLATVVAFTVHSVVDFLNVLSLGIQFALVIAIALASISPETKPVDEGMDSF